MRNSMLISLLGATFFLAACVKNNPDPSWIEINEFDLVANPTLTEGSLERNSFTHAWIYINEKFIAVVQLPCKIPVLLKGESNIRIYPTILNNGISETKLNYPFTAPHEQVINLVQNETVVINPVTKYLDGTSFFVEDFEGGNIKFAVGNGSLTNLVVENIEDERVGKVVVNSEANVWNAYLVNGADNEPFTFPFGSEIFLELETNNEASLVTTFIYMKQDGAILQQDNYSVTTARPGWKKMYFDLTEVVSNSGGYAFWFGFRVQLPDGASSSTVLLDNVKLVYR